MAFLRQMALDFVDLMMTSGVSVVVQIGEPWWWVTAEDEICLYDDAAMQLQSAAAQIEDLSGPLDADQLALLDWAGSQLATSTNDLRDAIRAHAAGAAKVLLLLFTPTILDPARPELQRANMPAGWAWPAYDRLQLEDYYWLAHGAEAHPRALPNVRLPRSIRKRKSCRMAAWHCNGSGARAARGPGRLMSKFRWQSRSKAMKLASVVQIFH